jgi:hypothetical protein
MKFIMQMRIKVFFIAGVLVFVASAGAQQKTESSPQRVNAYDVARETVLQGTVIAYSASSSAPPIGAHVTVQTSLGIVDVHIGNGRLLTANHLTLGAGDTIRITGESLPFGQTTVFAARVIQKGSQSVAVRSQHGMPLVNISRPQNGSAPSEGVR